MICAEYAASDDRATVITGHGVGAALALSTPDKVARREAATQWGGITMPLVPWDGRLFLCALCVSGPYGRQETGQTLKRIIREEDVFKDVTYRKFGD